MFVVSCNKINKDLITRAAALRDRILAKFREDVSAQNAKLCTEFDTISTHAAEVPSDTARLMFLKEYVTLLGNTDPWEGTKESLTPVAPKRDLSPMHVACCIVLVCLRCSAS